MSEEYRTTLASMEKWVAGLAEDPSQPIDALAFITCTTALLERLERLVKVVEQIRDRLPGQIAK